MQVTETSILMSTESIND